MTEFVKTPPSGEMTGAANDMPIPNTAKDDAVPT